MAISIGTVAHEINPNTSTPVTIDSGANRVAIIWVLDSGVTSTAPTIAGSNCTEVAGSSQQLSAT